MNHISEVIEHELGKDEIRLSGRGLCAQMVMLCRIVSAMFACSCPIVGGEVALCTLRCHGSVKEKYYVRINTPEANRMLS